MRTGPLDQKRSLTRPVLCLCVGAALLATATASIRSPDAEVGYRTAESLALRGTFAVDQVLESWPGFGLPVGRNNRRYSLFGPLLPIVQAPILLALEKVVDPASDLGWRDQSFQQIPPSHYYGDGLKAALYGKPLGVGSLRGHLLRSLVSLVDVVVLVLVALAAFDLGLTVTRTELGAWLAGILFPLGTFLFAYSTTAFSEPLALLLTLVGIALLAANDDRLADRGLQSQGWIRPSAAGLALGLATTAHVSAALGLPFAAVYAAFPGRARVRDRAGWVRGLAFLAGAGLPLALLATYNFYRFGNPFETGRGLQEGFDYGIFAAPWEGLFGLTLSFGKGLLWYCPLAVASLIAGRWSYRDYPRLVVIAVGAVVFRFLFMACRSDWHGGFCLGPRQLLLALPFAMLPGLLAGRAHMERLLVTAKRRVVAVGIVIALLAQQLYFSCGEVFQFYHLAKRQFARQLLLGEPSTFYFSWNTAPLGSILTLTRGPFLLRWLDVDPYWGWAMLTLVVGAGIGFLTWRLFPRQS
jgi:hypothetical protein